MCDEHIKTEVTPDWVTTKNIDPNVTIEYDPVDDRWSFSHIDGMHVIYRGIIRIDKEHKQVQLLDENNKKHIGMIFLR